MFWKVRAIPSVVMLFGFIPLMRLLLPPGGQIVTSPEVGL